MTISTRAPRLARPTFRPSRRLALVLAPLLVLGLAACQPSPQQESVRGHINESRRAHGVHQLGDDPIINHKAQAWAEHLASTGQLAHSSLSSGLDGLPWAAVAENVGRGSSIAKVHEQYMGSSRHRSNILDRRWDRVGTGHAVGGDGHVYTVQVFVDLG
jgi:uncharacterized protein YkwD